jgi:hypothetical protein
MRDHAERPKVASIEMLHMGKVQQRLEQHTHGNFIKHVMLEQVIKGD